jgi:hypothetical protein
LIDDVVCKNGILNSLFRDDLSAGHFILLFRACCVEFHETLAGSFGNNPGAVGPAYPRKFPKRPVKREFVTAALKL